MNVECTKKQYTIEVDYLKIATADWEGAFEDYLHNKLEMCDGVTDVDYDGHFGNAVYLTVDQEFDTPRLWQEIEKIITQHTYEKV